MENKISNRDRTFDFIKLYSMLMVITHHFMVCYLKYESIPLKIVNGKYGVQLFAIVLGIFAFRNGKKNSEDTLHYSLRRYAFFLICEFVINSIYYFFNIDESRLRMSFGFVIGQSVLLGDEIFPTIWFAKEFLVGSILSFLIGKKDFSKKDIAIIALGLGIIDEVFVAACVMGCLAEKLINENRAIVKKGWFQISCALIALILMIVLKKSSLTYFIFGICSMVMVTIVKNNALICSFSNHKIISYLGKLTMPMLLIHPCLIELVNTIGSSNSILLIIARYSLLLMLVIIASIAIDLIIKYLMKLANLIIDMLFRKIKALNND